MRRAALSLRTAHRHPGFGGGWAHRLVFLTLRVVSLIQVPNTDALSVGVFQNPSAPRECPVNKPIITQTLWVYVLIKVLYGNYVQPSSSWRVVHEGWRMGARGCSPRGAISHSPFTVPTTYPPHTTPRQGRGAQHSERARGFFISLSGATQLWRLMSGKIAALPTTENNQI